MDPLNSTSCSLQYSSVNTALLCVSIVLAIAVLIGISFTYQRVQLFKEVCWNVPGIAQPVNLLTHSADYTINVVLFGALAGEIVTVMAQNSNNLGYSGSSAYARIILTTVITPIVSVLEVSVKYFPLFACVDTPLPLVGHLVGLLYLPFLLAHVIYRDVMLSCSFSGNSVVTGLYVFGRAPVYMAFLWIIVWYIYALIRDIVVFFRHNSFKVAMDTLSGAHRTYTYYKQCVQHLLRSESDVKRRKAMSRVLSSKFLSFICPALTSPKRLPLRFAGAMTVAAFILYQLCLLLSGTLFYLLSLVLDLLRNNRGVIIEKLRALSQNFNAVEAYDRVFELIQLLLVVLPVSPIVSLLVCVLLMAHLIITVHKNLQDAARGDFQLPKTFSSFRLAASLKYAGYQVAFILTAFSAYTFVLWFGGLIGIGGYIAFRLSPEWAFTILAGIVIPVVWTGFVVALQAVTCKLFFLKRGGGKFIIISNKRLFNWLTYYLFTYNVVVGLVGAILRVLISASLSLLLMLRLDRVILMKGFEVLDFGNTNYLGFLHLDYTYNNAVVHVFVKLMSDVCAQKNVKPTLTFRSSLQNRPDQDLAFEERDEEAKVKDDVTTSAASRKIKNRWLVAYTLVRNPSIQPLTASRLQGRLDHTDEL